MTRELIEKAKSYLFRRQRAYIQTFNGPVAEEVLRDLAKFCRANETTVVPGSTEASLVLEGRREVWLRIQQHLKLTNDQLWELYRRIDA